jgi:hypothetical protein
MEWSYPVSSWASQGQVLIVDFIVHQVELRIWTCPVSAFERSHDSRNWQTPDWSLTLQSKPRQASQIALLSQPSIPKVASGPNLTGGAHK